MKSTEKRSLNRAILKLANDLRMIVALYLTSLLVAAGLISLAEGQSYLDSLWWCVVTATTVGYGDIAPATALGRIFAVFFQHFWIFGIAPLIVVNVIIRVAHDKDQYTHAEQEWVEAALVRVAAKLDIELPPPPQDTDFSEPVPGELLNQALADTRGVSVPSGEPGTAAAPANSSRSPVTGSGTDR